MRVQNVGTPNAGRLYAMVTREEIFHAELQGTETDPWGTERVGLEVTGQTRAATTA